MNSARFILDRMQDYKPAGSGWVTLCPAHHDREASLAVGVGDAGRVLLHCHAGCALGAVLQGLRLAETDLFPDREGRRIVVAIYDYEASDWSLVRQVIRFEPKSFTQRHRDSDGRWIWNVAGVPDTLYRQPRLRNKARVLIVEGEKDADRLWSLELPATTNAGGAGKWREAHTQQLVTAGVKSITILPDHDEAGRRHASAVADSCQRAGLAVSVLELPGLPEKGDVSDWLAGHTVDELRALSDAAPLWAPAAVVDDLDEDPDEDDDEPETELGTDVGNARRLVAQYGDSIRYAPAQGVWYVWDGARWRRDAHHEVIRLAKNCIRENYHAALDSTASDRDEWLRHWKRSEGAQRIRAMVEMAESEPEVRVEAGEFDRDPYLLNLLNGTLDLRTGTLRTPQREDLITKLAPVRFDTDAPCARWTTFLKQIFAGDTELIAYAQRVLGYCCTGATKEHKLFVLHGHGQNGKSTLIETVRAILGEGQYAESTPQNTLLVKHTDTIPADIAKLVGTRFVSAVETEHGKFLSEALVKTLTGGDRVNARLLHANWESFTPTFKILMATNHKPKIKGTDDGIWRRIHSIPFTVRVPDADVDPDLPETLRAEAAGILNWLVEGSLAWQRQGLRPPATVIEATQEYRLAQDVLAKFLDEATERSSPEGQCSPRKLYKAYQTWCEQTGERTVTEREFSEAIEEKGFRKGRTNASRFWRGISLLPEYGVLAGGDR